MPQPDPLVFIAARVGDRVAVVTISTVRYGQVNALEAGIVTAVSSESVDVATLINDEIVETRFRRNDTKNFVDRGLAYQTLTLPDSDVVIEHFSNGRARTLTAQMRSTTASIATLVELAAQLNTVVAQANRSFGDAIDVLSDRLAERDDNGDSQ